MLPKYHDAQDISLTLQVQLSKLEGKNQQSFVRHCEMHAFLRAN